MFNDLLPIAILGTAKSANPDFSTLDIPLQENLSIEEKILMAAAYTSIKEKAAFEPDILTASALPECPTENQPFTPQQVADILDRIVSNATKDDAFVVEEAADKIAAKGWVISPQVLLPLMNYAQQHPNIKPSTDNIIGERGKWLTNFYMGNKTAKEKKVNWETGTIQERATFFKEKYKSNPSEAIDLLKDTWKSETVSQKKDFIRILHQNPCAEIETFLDDILINAKEKDAELRKLMAETLVRIPNAKFTERLCQETFQYILFKSKLLSGGKLELTFPKSFTQAMESLGIHANSKEFDNVEQGFLYQLLGLLSPTLLENQFKMSPQDWLKAANKTTFSSPLIHAMEKAAILHQDRKWLQMILEYHITEKSLNYYWTKPTMALSNADFTLAMEQLSAKYTGRQMSYIFAARKTKWALSESILACKNMKEAAQKYVSKYPWECTDLTALAETAAQYAHSDSLKEIINVLYTLSQQSTQWLNQLDKLIQRMENRLAISILLG